MPDSDRTGAIALPELGINGKHWFNPSVISAYKRHFKGKELNSLGLSDVILEADKKKLQTS